MCHCVFRLLNQVHAVCSKNVELFSCVFPLQAVLLLRTLLLLHVLHAVPGSKYSTCTRYLLICNLIHLLEHYKIIDPISFPLV